MKYEENKKLIDAANILKEHCNKKFKGDKKCDCVFAKGEKCTLLEEYPCDWHTPKVIRWTPEDVALAKALKEVGVTEIYGSTSHFMVWKDENMHVGYLPSLAFRNLDYMETVKIDDIIKEAEEDK